MNNDPLKPASVAASPAATPAAPDDIDAPPSPAPGGVYSNMSPQLSPAQLVVMDGKSQGIPVGKHYVNGVPFTVVGKFTSSDKWNAAKQEWEGENGVAEEGVLVYSPNCRFINMRPMSRVMNDQNEIEYFYWIDKALVPKFAAAIAQSKAADGDPGGA